MAQNNSLSYTDNDKLLYDVLEYRYSWILMKSGMNPVFKIWYFSKMTHELLKFDDVLKSS